LVLFGPTSQTGIDLYDKGEKVAAKLNVKGLFQEFLTVPKLRILHMLGRL